MHIVCVFVMITNASPTYGRVHCTDRAALNLQSCKSKTEREPARVVIIEERTALGQMCLSLYMCTEHNERTSSCLNGKRRRSDQLQRKKAPTKVIITVILSIAVHGEEADDTVYVMSVNVLSL